MYMQQRCELWAHSWNSRDNYLPGKITMEILINERFIGQFFMLLTLGTKGWTVRTRISGQWQSMFCVMPNPHQHQASEWPETLTPDPSNRRVGWSTWYSPGRYWRARFFRSTYTAPFLASTSPWTDCLQIKTVFSKSLCLMPLPIEWLKKYLLCEVNFFLYQEKIILPLLKCMALWPCTITLHSSQYLCQEREGIFFLKLLRMLTMSARPFISEKERGDYWVLLSFLEDP